MTVILLFLRKSSITWFTFSSLFVVGCPKHSAYSLKVIALLNLENHSKTCVLPIDYSPKATFIISEFPQHFSPLPSNIFDKHYSFKVVIFKNHEWNNTHLYLKRCYSSITHITVVFHAGNVSANTTLSTSNGRSSC